jgi:hypothetical protein
MTLGVILTKVINGFYVFFDFVFCVHSFVLVAPATRPDKRLGGKVVV